MKELFDRYENLLKEGRTVDASGLRQVIEMCIESSENEMQEQARIVGMGAERELALIAKVESLEKENASLKQDAERLMFVMQDIDGFEGVKKDKYDFACDVANEHGREEPTKEDETEGMRRLFDATMKG